MDVSSDDRPIEIGGDCHSNEIILFSMTESVSELVVQCFLDEDSKFNDGFLEKDMFLKSADMLVDHFCLVIESKVPLL